MAWSDDDPAAEVIAPRFDRVDYSTPGKALDLCEAFGSEAEIRKVAARLKATSRLDTLRAIDTWIRKDFVYDAEAAFAWRTFDTMRADRTYGGCADHAVLFGSLARAAGIPTVFVKTMDCDWIREFVKGPEPARWSGHCFLEVNVDDRWMLLDASQMVLYREHDTDARIYPGSRYAYDKGHDPFAMVKSMRWQLWKKQTRTYFTGFDLAKLPVGGGESLRGTALKGRELDLRGGITLVCTASLLDRARGRLGTSGLKVDRTVTNAAPALPAAARGSAVVFLAPGKQALYASAFFEGAYLGSYERFRTQLLKHSAGIFGRELADGTRLYVIFAADADAVVALLGTWSPVKTAPIKTAPGSAADLPAKVFVAAHAPYWQWLSARCEKLGMPRRMVRSFNYRFDQELPRAKGHTLVITWVGDVLVLPDRYHGQFLPAPRERVEKLLKKQAHGRLDKTLDDGTRVVLLFARDEPAMRAAVAAFTFAPRAKPLKKEAK